MGYGPGCGWLKVDTVEEEVAAGFRQAVATQQKKDFFLHHTPACVALQLLLEQVK